MPQFLLLVTLSIIDFINQGRTEAFKHNPTPTPYHDWDYLIFSQRWPNAACAEWEESKSGNTCNLPQDKTLWTIHGLWPTKIGQLGPLFCPSAIHFNPDDLNPMLSDLNVFWINIEANTKATSLWAHEWKKHGTCAAVLPELDSVTNYFKVGLQLNRQYNLANMLALGGILPGTTTYDIGVIYNVVKNATNKSPRIQCVIDKKTKESFISEIRICLDKNMELTDCDPATVLRGGIDSNCDQKKPVYYISSLPSSNDLLKEEDDYLEKQSQYIWLYYFLRGLIWVTL